MREQLKLQRPHPSDPSPAASTALRSLWGSDEGS